MTLSLPAALRMHRASVAAPAPLAAGAPAEPCAAMSAAWPANRAFGTGGILAPAFGTRLGSLDGSDRFGGITRPTVGGGWYREDQAQLAGGGPLRR